MSFYVTLPSNSSRDFFAQNTISNFTTQLKIPITLNGPYEVALVEITYDHCWDVDMGELVYFHSDPNVLFRTQITLRDGENFPDFLSRINYDIGEKIVAYEIEKKKQSNPELNKTEIADKLTQELVTSKNVPIILFKEHKLIFNTMGEDHHFVLSGLFGEILGVNNTLLNQKSKFINVSTYNRNFYFITSLYIYSDIIKYQYVGDELAPLLRNVVVPNSAKTTQNIIYDSPHYLPVNKTIIDNINISIRDEIGNFIHFKRGKSIVKLHFRPIKNGF